MKRLIGILLVLVLATLACSFNPTLVQSDFPTPPVTNTPVLIQPTLAVNLVTPSALPETTVPQPQAPATVPNLTVEQLRNATLSITGSDQIIRSMEFKDGKYELGSDPAQSGYISVTMGEKIGFGDLIADGAQDAVISIGENYGGTGVFVSVVAVLNNNGQPNPVATAVIEDRAMINQLGIVNGEILVDATTHGPNDPMCCPSLPSTRAYRLIENTLVLSRLSTKTPDGAERVIKIESPADGAEVNGPFVIKGSVSISPFENSLVYKVFQQDFNEPLDMAGFTIHADGIGGPGTFELALDFSQKGFKGPLRIEISDSSPADGSTLALATIYVMAK